MKFVIEYKLLNLGLNKSNLKFSLFKSLKCVTYTPKYTTFLSSIPINYFMITSEKLKNNFQRKNIYNPRF